MKILKRIEAWPLEKLILTHSHWDHTQGVIYFRKKVEEEGISPIEIFASEKAIPYLKNQSYNSCFAAEAYHSDFLNIENVKPLRNDEKIYVSEDLPLEIIETPGHMPDHISIYDKKNKTLFVGDTIGMHWFPDFYVCNSNSIYWNEKDYLESINKLKMLDLEFLCIAHFGVIIKEDIGRFFDKSISMYYKWMEIFDQNSDKLDNPHFIIDILWDSAYNDFSDKPILKDTLEISVLNAINYYKGLKSL